MPKLERPVGRDDSHRAGSVRIEELVPPHADDIQELARLDEGAGEVEDDPRLLPRAGGAEDVRGVAPGQELVQAEGCSCRVLVGRAIQSPTLRRVRNVLNFFGRVIRAMRIAATDKRIPRSLRYLAAIGIAPIPGPIDEALLLIAAIPLALFYRRPLAEAWGRADRSMPMS